MWNPAAPSSKSRVVSAPTKVLQSKSGYSMLIQRPSGEYLILRGQQINALQHLERTTGECLVASRDKRIQITDAPTKFDEAVRLTVLDGASSNARSERLGQRNMFSSILFSCEDHITFNIADAVGRILD